MARISRSWVGASALGTIMTIAGGHALAQRAQISPECRQPIREQCAGASDRRSCIARAMQSLSDDCRKQISRAAAAETPPAQGMVEHSYGTDPLQKLDLRRAAGAGRAPLIVFIHGGGWSIGDKSNAIAAKADHFSARGLAFASLNYRLVPAATVEQQAGDIASAIAWLTGHAADQGIDSGRIIIMGHSAGAHLAALVASDPSYLTAVKVPFAAVKGAVLLDGAAYDVAVQAANPRNRVADMYAAAFGKNPARHRRLSPLHHAAAPNAPSWLILAIAERRDSSAQGQALAAALTRAGAKALMVHVPNSSHGKLNRQLGAAGDFATNTVDAFLSGL